VPFDLLSMFLLTAWQVCNGWSRAETLRNLSKPRYADHARLFGFQNGVYPTEGGLRHFLTVLGKNSTAEGECVSVEQGNQVSQVAVQQLNRLLSQSVALVRESGVLSGTA
jgi:hypothetical protein